MRPKLCYILPEYDRKTPTHFAHLYDFIKELAGIFDVFLVIEKGVMPTEVGLPKIYAQKFRFLPLRVFENFAVLKLARLKGYKTFYVHYSFLSAFNASLITKILGGKVFYWNCGEPWKYRRGFFRRLFEGLTYRMINFLVTGTNGLKREYGKHYEIPLTKIKVMPNWIDINKIKNQISNIKNTNQKLKNDLNIKNEKVVLFVHRLSRRKGAHWLSDIIQNLKDENAVFVIIGDGPERENIKYQISNIKNVRLLGAVPNEEIYKYYALADVFIMPSEEEGFPRVILEAMAMEVPFVAFDVGGVKEIIPPEFLPYVVETGDIESFSLKIKELLNLPEQELNRLKSGEKEWVKKYDLPKVIEIFKNIFGTTCAAELEK